MTSSRIFIFSTCEIFSSPSAGRSYRYARRHSLSLHGPVFLYEKKWNEIKRYKLQCSTKLHTFTTTFLYNVYCRLTSVTPHLMWTTKDARLIAKKLDEVHAYKYKALLDMAYQGNAFLSLMGNTWTTNAVVTTEPSTPVGQLTGAVSSPAPLLENVKNQPTNQWRKEKRTQFYLQRDERLSSYPSRFIRRAETSTAHCTWRQTVLHSGHGGERTQNVCLQHNQSHCCVTLAVCVSKCSDVWELIGN